MRDYTLAHLSDAVLLRELAVLAARDRETTAWLLAHIAEVDARKAYAPAGHASLFAYCVEELRFPRMRPTSGSRPPARHGSFPSCSRR